MKYRKTILKEAGVLLIGALLIFSSVAVMATTSEKTLLIKTDMKMKAQKLTQDTFLQEMSSGITGTKIIAAASQHNMSHQEHPIDSMRSQQMTSCLTKIQMFIELFGALVISIVIM